MKHFKSILALSLFLSLGTLVGCEPIPGEISAIPSSSSDSNSTTSNIPNDSNSISSIPSESNSTTSDIPSDSNSTTSDTTSEAPSISQNVIDVAQALNIAKELADGEETSITYIVQGIVDDLYNATYGNCHLIDNDNNDITIYGMYNKDGTTRFDSFKNPPKEGDTIIVEGKLMNYYNSYNDKNTYEIKNAKLLFVNGNDQAYYETLVTDTIVDSDISYDENGWTYSGNYYTNLNSSSTGTTLLTSLQSINSTKRKTTVGYSSMWNYYGKTDYDPNDKSKYIAFYKGTTHEKGLMNKEHVWPDSRGGNTIEGDIHIIRPTLRKDNSSRGNSFYVEDKNSTSGGWDPKAAGMNENYRGQAARIVFYGVIANKSLKLVDTNDDSPSNNSMGKLSDLLKWNLQYPVQAEEIRRNNGIESIQGNRNPFIDNPSFACSIWGSTNATTKQICSATAAISYKKEINQRNNQKSHFQEKTIDYDYIKISITTEPKKEFE